MAAEVAAHRGYLNQARRIATKLAKSGTSGALGIFRYMARRDPRRLLNYNDRQDVALMWRGVAIALAAIVAFDYFFLDARYIHAVQTMLITLAHFF